MRNGKLRIGQEGLEKATAEDVAGVEQPPSIVLEDSENAEAESGAPLS